MTRPSRPPGVYSQNDEELHILRYFADKPVGRFLDIGAFDGLAFSNTRALAERGWGGVMIEASPDVYPKLEKNCKKQFPQVALIHAALGLEDGECTLYSTPDAVSTTEAWHRDLWAKNVQFREVVVPQISVASLLNGYPGPYEFVNVDTEGTSGQLFALLDLTAMKTQFAIVEWRPQDRQQILDHATRHRFRLAHTNGENFIFSH